MGWLLCWLIFGLLAAYEAGGLAMNAGGDWGPIRALAFVVASVLGLGVIAWRAIVSGRPSRLRWVWLLSVAVLAVCLWDLYGSGTGSWVTVAMFGTAYSLLCLLAASVAMFLAWRRHRAHEAHKAHEMSQRERHRRMDGIRAHAMPLSTAARGDPDPLDVDSDYTLPARPKWEES